VRRDEAYLDVAALRLHLGAAAALTLLRHDAPDFPLLGPGTPRLPRGTPQTLYHTPALLGGGNRHQSASTPACRSLQPACARGLLPVVYTEAKILILPSCMPSRVDLRLNLPLAEKTCSNCLLKTTRGAACLEENAQVLTITGQ